MTALEGVKFARRSRYWAIRKAMDARSLSYVTLAAEIGVSAASVRQYMSKLYKGEKCSNKVAAAINRYFDGVIMQDDAALAQ